ncbi:MAG: nucleotidyltransferase domain-containing protein [Desulfuromonadaceae bacterium]|nr:nucleotidyltransferase domain-containing protein [Desulfuromonadaceae bacterium]MDD2856340.1 nucleotidyltransferase domain-containing protein [Desulfuromonadaceae bacterium]
MASGKDKQLIYREIEQYVTLLKTRNISILQAYLFGSYARGTADEWSDIDLAVVTDNFEGDSFDFRFLLTKLARSIDPDIEPHPYRMIDFNNSNPVADEILRTGERLF